MRRFKVENHRKEQTIKVILHKPPYENENILHKTSWKEEDVTITDITPTFIGEE